MSDPVGRGFEPTRERRQYQRVSTPAIAVRFDDDAWVTRDWSLGGFSIDDYDGTRTAGALVTIVGLSRPGGQPVSVHVRGRVIRADHSGRRLIVSFLHLDPGAYEVLSALMHGGNDLGAPA